MAVGGAGGAEEIVEADDAVAAGVEPVAEASFFGTKTNFLGPSSVLVSAVGVELVVEVAAGAMGSGGVVERASEAEENFSATTAVGFFSGTTEGGGAGFSNALAGSSSSSAKIA